MTQMTQDEIAKKLSDNNIRPSVQRMAIYDFLVKNPVHPTAETIYENLSQTMPTLSRTTIYNTLRQFSDCNLIQTVTIEDGELRYDADTSNHIHFKCTECGKIFDILGTAEISSSVVPKGFLAKKSQTNIWGICENCLA
jgi:Fe2+ or Zn2+ uptake regulation protein